MIQSKAIPTEHKSMVFPDYVQKMGHSNFSQLPGKACVAHTGPTYTVQEDYRFSLCLPDFWKKKSLLCRSKSIHLAQEPQWQISWRRAAALLSASKQH